MAWTPYAVVSMWSAWGYQVPNITSILTRMFAKSASFYNPLIYFAMSGKFRRDVRTLLPCARENKDKVRLRSFNALRPKDGATAIPTAIPTATAGQFYYHQGETKYALGQLLDNHLPTRLQDPQHTPPPINREINCVPSPAEPETAEYEIDRL